MLHPLRWEGLMGDMGPALSIRTDSITNNNEQGGIFWHFLAVCRGRRAFSLPCALHSASHNTIRNAGLKGHHCSS